MATKNPADVATKWAQNLGNAGTSITQGVNAVTVAPGQAAAAQKQVWVQNVTSAAEKWATNVAKISAPDWKNAMLTKGIPRISTGAQAAQPKMEAFMRQLLPYIENQVQSLPPRGNLAANKARLLQFIDGMASFQKS
jgi:hypothetical protein